LKGSDGLEAGLDESMMLVEYPQWLEGWWVDRACRHYRVARLEDCITPLEKAVQSVSDSFSTDSRGEVPDYQGNPELMLAYGLFYFPQSFTRIQYVLSQIVAQGWNSPADRPVRILDLGAGAGAAGFGAATVLQRSQIQGWALDHSDYALSIHAELSAIAPAQSWQQERIDLRRQQKHRLPKMDLILLSFALNEMPAMQEKTLDFWLRRLHPRGVLLILEPFSKESISQLSRYRDRIVQETNYRILLPGRPLPDYPMLQKGDCEYVREWQIPESLRLLNRNLRRSIDVLKFCFLVITSQNETPLPSGASHFRLIAPFLQGKGKWRAAGYASDGVRREYEILSRHLTPELKRKLHTLKAGDIVRAVNVHPAGDNFRFTLDEP
jgi:ribosomal protein RSM22 (predicted rRNA methylase)